MNILLLHYLKSNTGEFLSFVSGCVRHESCIPSSGSQAAFPILASRRFQCAILSPTGLLILAQGIALGKAPWMIRRLKACFISCGLNETMRQTFSLHRCLLPIPRALPWASMNETLGLQKLTPKRACIDTLHSLTP